MRDVERHVLEVMDTCATDVNGAGQTVSGEWSVVSGASASDHPRLPTSIESVTSKTPIQRALVGWYEGSRRDLPWRRTRDPYAIWISEIMLQQTRVAAVIPYYERFLKRFPNAAALARADEADVLAMWSGLGYYSRARNLQKAARQVVERGGFPSDYDSIRELAGVGDYTAAAVASIAFGLPHAVIDGNVQRVIVRLNDDDNVDVRREADGMLDRRDPGQWNQALMELGATVCTPRDPACGECPLRKTCEARRRGTQHALPSKRNKPAPVRLTRTLLVIERRGRILLAPGARVKGFWDLPEPFDSVRMGEIAGEFRHTITHRHYTFIVRRAVVKGTPEGFRWFQRSNEIPLSTTAKKALRCLKDGTGRLQ
jgi:A/G-specific adenine glycosylase